MDISVLVQCRTGTEEYIEGLVWGLDRIGTRVMGIGRSGILQPGQPGLGLALRSKRPLWEKWWWEQYGMAHARLSDATVVHIPYLTHPPRPLALPTVVSVLDLIPYRLSAYQSRWRERAYFAQVQKRLPHAQAFVAISEATRDDVAHLMPGLASRTVVIPSGVHPAFFQPLPAAEVAEVLERYQLRRHPRILYVGGYDQRKNVGTLIQAAADVLRALGGELWLVGAAAFPEIQAMIAASGAANMMSTPFLPRRELVALYQAADVFAYPSRYEGFGLPPAQALAMGIPVVASNTPAVAETVGESAVTVPPDDVGAWVEALQTVLKSPSRITRMVEHGKHRAQDFSWETVARQYQSLYQQVGAR